MNELLARAAALDPTVLLGAARLCSTPVGIGLGLLGLLLLFWGTHGKLLRLHSGLAAFATGWFGASAVLAGKSFLLGPEFLPLASALALGILGWVWPVAAAFVISAVVGARLAAGWVPLPDPLLKGLVAGATAGVLGSFFFRGVLAIATAVVGAILLTVGVWALALGTGAGGFLQSWPVLPLLPASLLAIAGAALQLTRRDAPSREQAAAAEVAT